MKSFLRFLWRNRLYSLISLLGLSISLAFTVIILSYSIGQYRASKTYPDYSNIYGLCYEDMNIMCYGMADELRNSLPEAVSVSKFSAPADGISAKYKDQTRNATVMSADSWFFDMFHISLIDGSVGDLMQSTGNVLLSERFASMLQDTGNLTGQTIVLGGEEFTIAGTVPDFGNGILPYTDIIANMDMPKFTGQYSENPFSVFGSILTFIKVNEDTDIDYLEKKVGEMANNAIKANTPQAESMNFSLVRLDRLYFSPANVFLNNGNIGQVRILLLAGITMLLSTLFNYINLNTAITGKRGKEMATRRLLGSGKKQIFITYMIEAAAFTSVCFLIGLLLASGLAPVIDRLVTSPESTVRIDAATIFSPIYILPYIGLVIIVSAISGIIPAAIASGFSPIDVVKGTMKVRNRMVFTKIFIVIQNIISVVLIALAVTMEMQVRHMLSRPVGCDYEDIYCIDNIDNTFRDRLTTLPCVENVGIATCLPGAIGSFSTLPNENGNEVSYGIIMCDTTAFNMLGFNIKEQYCECLPGTLWMSESAMRLGGYSSENHDIGNTIAGQGYGETVCGVVRDFAVRNVTSAEKDEAALISIQDRIPWGQCVIKTKGDHSEARQAITRLYEEHCMEKHGIVFQPWDNNYMTDILESALDGEKRNMRLIEVFMIVAILISLSGLVAISIFYTDSNTKSIALHKIYGGTVGSETVRNTKMYMLMTLAADVIAVPVAVMFCRRYLENFAYRIEPYVWIFAVTVILSLTITFVSVVLQVGHAARTNPAEALKSE